MKKDFNRNIKSINWKPLSFWVKNLDFMHEQVKQLVSD